MGMFIPMEKNYKILVIYPGVEPGNQISLATYVGTTV